LKYIPSPANKLLLLPLQIVPLLAVIVGIELTVTVDVAVFVQLLTSVPVTEYIVVSVGLTVFEAPVPSPLLHE